MVPSTQHDDAARQTSITGRGYRAEPELTIVCVSYKRYRNIAVLVNCLLAQTLQNFRLLIIHDGYDAEMDAVLSPYKALHPEVIDYTFTAQRFNDYGHSLRDIGISAATTDYLLITNDDNYYCPLFVEYIFAPIHAASQRRPDVVYCDMIHSHNNPGIRQQPPYQLFETRPERYFIDMGCFIARTDLAKQVGFTDKHHDGDATYFEDLVKAAGPDPVLVKVPHVLFVHN